LGDNVTLTLSDRRSGLDYAVLNHGHFGVKLHRSKHGGWEEIAAPAYPQKPEGLIDRDGWGKDIPYSLINIFALDWRPGRGGSSVVWDHSGRALPLARPRLELGADSLPVGRSQAPTMDGRRHGVAGDPFHLRRSARLPGRANRRLVRRRVVDARRRRDLGLPRRRHVRRLPAPRYGPRPERAGPHCLVQSPSSPDRLWVQHHNGIFRSDDGSASWREIAHVPPSSFGFAVAAHPRDSDTAWFVPAIKDERRIPVEGKLVVTRTRDGGETFDVLREGLPQSHAYDLVYRHALAIDNSGDRLAFATTTGGLYVTEDQGFHWLEVSHTLPPAHAVRFAPGPARDQRTRHVHPFMTRQASRASHSN